MNNNRSTPKLIAASIVPAATAGIGIWLFLLIRGALHIRASQGAIVQSIQFGPLNLLDVHRFTASGAIHVTFTFKSGLLVYCAGWLCIGLLLGVARALVRQYTAKGRSLQPPNPV